MESDDTQAMLSDPLETLQRVLKREVFRADRRRLELAEIGNALLQLSKQSERPARGARGVVWEPVSADMAPSLIERLLETTDGPLRTCVVGLQVPASTTPSSSRPRPASPRASPSAPSTRSTSTTSPTGGPGCRPGPTGEDQRICMEPPSDFAVFGESAVPPRSGAPPTPTSS